jgi:hypothetical protein
LGTSGYFAISAARRAFGLRLRFVSWTELSRAEWHEKPSPYIPTEVILTPGTRFTVHLCIG